MVDQSVEHADRHGLRRPHGRRRSRRPDHRSAHDLQRDGHRRRHGLRSSLPGHPLTSKWLVTGQFAYHRENVNTLPGPGGNIIPYVDNRAELRSRTGGFVGPDGDGQFADEEVHALRLPRRRELLPREPRPQGRLRVSANRRQRHPQHQRRPARRRSSILFADDPLQRPVYTHTFFASLDSTIENPVDRSGRRDAPERRLRGLHPGSLADPDATSPSTPACAGKSRRSRASTTSPTSTSITSRRASASPGTS